MKKTTTPRSLTTIDTITADQCSQLADEAEVAGDERVYRIATLAARYLTADAADCRDESAVRTCLAAIREAEAQ